jgi:CDP-4-dehydro-6-deoxyglucose reductase, E1
MTEWFFPTGFKSWDREEDEAISRVIASDRFTYGAETEALEHELAEYHGRRYCVVTNSGSSSNWIATAALFYVEHEPLKRGDFAIVPSIAWATTWSPLIVYGLNLVVADADATWNSVPSELFDHVRPRLIIYCPILGNPAHFEAWAADFARRPDQLAVYAVEDACESLGAVSAGGRHVGTFGHMSTLSFFMSHQLAGIEGGAVLCDDDELYRLLRQLRNHGWARDTDAAPDFAGEYRFLVPGMNVRPLEINAAVQRCQLRKLDGFIAERRRNLDFFRSLVAGLPIESQRMEGEPSPFGLSFTVESKEVRGRLARALRAEGVNCRLPTGGSFARHPLAAHCSFLSRRHVYTPGADAIHDTGMFLGLAPWDISDKIEHAVKVIKATLAEKIA